MAKHAKHGDLHVTDAMFQSDSMTGGYKQYSWYGRDATAAELEGIAGCAECVKLLEEALERTVQYRSATNPGGKCRDNCYGKNGCPQYEICVMKDPNYGNIY